MPRYRAKPAEVEAFQWQGVNTPLNDLPEWVDKLVQSGVILLGSQTLRINTGNGLLHVEPDHWIIHREDGGFDCLPDEVFSTRYEEAA